MNKTLLFDVETTGLDKEKCAIIQIAGLIEIDGEVKEEFDIKIAPFEGAEINQDALDVIKKTEEEIKAYQDPIKGYNQFKNICLKYVNKYDKHDKMAIVAHNISFDFDFLVNWSRRSGDSYLGSFIDFKKQFCTLRVVQGLKYVGVFPETENNKLVTLCEKLNISFTGMAHDALFDIRATHKLYKAIYTILSRCKKKEL